MNDDLNSQKLDHLLEKARSAEPIVTIDEAGEIVRSAPPAAGSYRDRQNKSRLLKALLTAGIFSLLLIGYLAIRNNEPDPAPPLNKIQDEKISLPPAGVQKNTNTDHAAEPFPPVYKEENITRPDVAPVASSNENEPAKSLPPVQKIRTQTSGAAIISFVHDDRKVRITLFHGDVKGLYIDDVMISAGDYSSHAGIIEEGKKLEKASRSEKDKAEGLSDEEVQAKDRHEAIVSTLIRELGKDGLVKNGDHFEFRLQWNRFFVNGEEQTHELYEKYRLLYEQSSGARLEKNSNIRISH